jgi:hypothetical protein
MKTRNDTVYSYQEYALSPLRCGAQETQQGHLCQTHLDLDWRLLLPSSSFPPTLRRLCSALLLYIRSAPSSSTGTPPQKLPTTSHRNRVASRCELRPGAPPPLRAAARYASSSPSSSVLFLEFCPALVRAVDVGILPGLARFCSVSTMRVAARLPVWVSRWRREFGFVHQILGEPASASNPAVC